MTGHKRPEPPQDAEAIVLAVLHQLEHGEASDLIDHAGEAQDAVRPREGWPDGSVGAMEEAARRDLAWCRAMLRRAGALLVAARQAGALFTVGPWAVRIVRTGDAYGLDDRLTHDKADPLVEFYDTRQAGPKFGPRGQFVSRYDLSTLLDHRPGAGLCLQGGVPSWTVTGADFERVAAFLRTVTP